jgi:hypothetical protein
MRYLVLPLAVCSLVACEQAPRVGEPAQRSTRPNAVELPEPPRRVSEDSERMPALAAVGVRPGRSPASKGAESCPAGMALVEGDYCPDVKHTCLRYLDPPGRYHEFRCAEYGPPRCASRQHVKMRFCIDRDEFGEAGDGLPANFRSFTHAERSCGALGKRTCLESEWNFACEGEAMRPYPYGFERDSTACNADHAAIVTAAGTLKDLRAPGDAYPRCVSPFGVRNMTGNLEEFVAIDGSRPVRPAMKGAYWQPGRNTCRASQTAHDRYYHGIETGFRCCSDAD